MNKMGFCCPHKNAFSAKERGKCDFVLEGIGSTKEARILFTLELR